VGFVTNYRHDAHDFAVVIENHLSLATLEIERAALGARPC
jgi:hypothetical protein